MMIKNKTLSSALAMCGLSDTGLMRTRNEDAIYFDQDLGYVILADGMGGYNAGDVASQMAVTEISKVLNEVIASTTLHAKSPNMPWPTSYTLLRTVADLANSKIYSLAQKEIRYNNMGTTLIIGLFYDNRVLIAHVGDSRVYRYRNGELLQLTRDHSIVQEQISAGLITEEEAEHAEYKNLLTRALGSEAEVIVELQEFSVQTDDIYLFCSDGLSGLLQKQDIIDVLHKHQNVLTTACKTLVDHANQAGGIDNISVVLTHITADFRANRSWWARFLNFIK